MNNAAALTTQTRIVIETSRTGHSVYADKGEGLKYLGPIALKHGDAFDVIPRAVYRAEVYGWPNVSRDVELRRFGGERVAVANAAFAAACGR